jgi:hypothetical protein
VVGVLAVALGAGWADGFAAVPARLSEDAVGLGVGRPQPPAAVAVARLDLALQSDGAGAVARGAQLGLAGKVRSGCRGLLGERDVVSEAFELFDEAFGLAFGVAVDEVVGAEVAVGLAGGQHVPDRADQ